MRMQRHWLMTGAAVFVALGVGIGAGFGVAARLDPSGASDSHAEGEEGGGEHAEDAGEEGLVALTPDQASKAGVSVIAVQRGGGGSELKLPGPR